MRKLAVLMACLIFTGINAASQPEVKLLQVESYTTSHYGYYTEQRDMIVKVKNLGYEKKITMFAEIDNGSWQEFGNGTFITASGDGYELWKINAYAMANPLNGQPGVKFGTQFVIKYVVNGVTYWDNNNGANYRMGKSDGDMLVDGNVLLKTAYAYKGSYNNLVNFYGTVLVRNLAYGKAVKIVYTYDNWATSYVANAAFSSGRSYPYGDYIKYPTIYGAEEWGFSASMPLSVSTIQYAVVYEVNGQTYWGNNGGINYTINVQ